MIGDIKDVQGFSNNFAHQDTIEFEDTGVVAVRFHNGALGTINYTVNSFGKNMESRLSVSSLIFEALIPRKRGKNTQSMGSRCYIFNN